MERVDAFLPPVDFDGEGIQFGCQSFGRLVGRHRVAIGFQLHLAVPVQTDGSRVAAVTSMGWQRP